MYQMPLINQYICLFEFFFYQFDLSCCLPGAMQQVQLSNQTEIRIIPSFFTDDETTGRDINNDIFPLL